MSFNNIIDSYQEAEAAIKSWDVNEIEKLQRDFWNLSIEDITRLQTPINEEVSKKRWETQVALSSLRDSMLIYQGMQSSNSDRTPARNAVTPSAWRNISSWTPPSTSNDALAAAPSNRPQTQHEYNYSTADQINGTIQDSIWNSQDINAIKSQLANTTNVTVAIKNSSSSLRMYSSNLRSKIWNLPQWQNLTLLTNHQIGNNWKLFLHVKLPNGTEGYISADYVKAENPASPAWVTSIPSNRPRPAQRPSPRPRPAQRPAPVQAGVVWGISWRPAQAPTIDRIDWPHSIWILPVFTASNGFGWLWAIWPDQEVANSELVDYRNDQERLLLLQEKLSNPKVYILATMLQVWTDAAQKEATSMMTAWWLFNDKKVIEDSIENVNALFSNFLNSADSDDTTINTLIDNLFSEIAVAERVQYDDIIDNIGDTRALIDSATDTNKDTHKIELLSLMSAGAMTDGNTEKVKDILVQDILQAHPEMVEKIYALDNLERISSLDIANILGISPNRDTDKYAENVRDAWAEWNAQWNTAETRRIYEDELLKHDPTLSWTDLRNAINEAIQQGADMYAQNVLSIEIVRGISTQSDGSSETLFAKLDGFWQTAGEWIGNNAGLIVVSLIPMGAWFALAAWAAKVWSIAMRSAMIANRMNSLGRVWTFGSRFAQWTAFYEGMNTMNNFLYLEQWDDWQHLFTGADDYSEIIKMGLTWNMFGYLSRMRVIPEWAGLSAIATREGAQNAIKLLFAEWAGFAAIDYTVENAAYALFDSWEGRTWEELLDVFVSWAVLGWAFRWAWALSTRAWNLRLPNRSRAQEPTSVEAARSSPEFIWPWRPTARVTPWIASESLSRIEGRTITFKQQWETSTATIRNGEVTITQKGETFTITPSEFLQTLDGQWIRMYTHSNWNTYYGKNREYYGMNWNRVTQLNPNRLNPLDVNSPVPNAAARADDAVPNAAARAETVSQNIWDITPFTQRLIRALRKWDETTIGEYTIKRGNNNEYTVIRWWESPSTTIFTNIDDAARNINTSLSTSANRLRFIESAILANKRVALGRAAWREITVPWEASIKIQNNWKILKQTEWNWWREVSVENLSPAQASKALDAMWGAWVSRSIGDAINRNTIDAWSSPAAIRQWFKPGERVIKIDEFMSDLPFGLKYPYKVARYVSARALHDVLTPKRIVESIIKLDSAALRSELLWWGAIPMMFAWAWYHLFVENTSGNNPWGLDWSSLAWTTMSYPIFWLINSIVLESTNLDELIPWS